MTTAVLSNYLENKIIDHVLRNVAYTTPGLQVWIALYTTDPTDADTGTEVSGTGYARQQVTAWDAPASRATQNTNAITWAQAGSNWGTVTHIGIRDASAAGNLLFYGALTTSKAVPSGVTFSIAAGDLDVTLDGAFATYLSHALLNHVLRNTAYTSPGTSIYVALHTADPTPAMSGAECSGNNYSRKQITAWDVASNGATQNTNTETFATPSGPWGAVTHTAIWDAATLGNGLFFGAVGTSFSPDSGDTVQFQAGTLDVSVS